MADKDLINEKVIHKIYGEGVIIKNENGYIDVEFKKGYKSKFATPSCFDKFLKFKDEEKQQEMLEDVAKWKGENGILEKEKIHQKTIATQAGIQRRQEEREIRRLERAKEVAERNKMFVSKKQ